MTPHRRRAVDFEHVFLIGFPDEPCTLREFGLELAGRPARIADEAAHCVLLRSREPRCFVQRDVMAALEKLRRRMPAERGENELLVLHRASVQNGNPREGAEQFVGDQIPDELASGAVENQPETAFLSAVIRQNEHRPAEIRLDESRMGDEQAAREAG